MLCPKCAREISSEKNVCDYCGFTFQTPKNETSAGTAALYTAAPEFAAAQPAAPAVPAITDAEPAASAPTPPWVSQSARPAAPEYQAVPVSQPDARSYTAPYAQHSFAAPGNPSFHAPYTPAAPQPQSASSYTAASAYAPAYSPAPSQAEPLSVGQYIGMLLLGMVPLLGLIFYIIWACQKKGNPNRRHFATAALILQIIGLVFLLGAAFILIAYYTPLFFYVFR